MEDDQHFAGLCRKFLERDDAITVASVADPREALEAFERGSYDCVVSDHEMPGMTGVEFLAAVRDVDPAVPRILFTGKSNEALAAGAIDAGVTGYLRKGDVESIDRLATRIRRAVAEA